MIEGTFPPQSPQTTRPWNMMFQTKNHHLYIAFCWVTWSKFFSVSFEPLKHWRWFSLLAFFPSFPVLEHIYHKKNVSQNKRFFHRKSNCEHSTEKKIVELYRLAFFGISCPQYCPNIHQTRALTHLMWEKPPCLCQCLSNETIQVQF